MGTCYYGICQDCKRWINLDKFWSWSACQNADHASIEKTDLEEYKENGWIYRALRLHIFLATHNGHRIGVYSEHEEESESRGNEEWREQYPWPTSLLPLIEKIDMVPSVDRIIINTPLGEVYIDNRRDVINCFRFVNGKRIDTVLLEAKKDDK